MAVITRVRSFLESLAKRRAPKARTDADFNVSAMVRPMRAPSQSTGAYSWDLSAIMLARDAQMAGRFAQPVRLAASMRTDDALAVAYKNRLAPQRSLAIRLDAAPGARGARVAGEGEELFGDAGFGVTRDTLSDINGALANHGVAVGFNEWVPRADGSRVDVIHHYWPLEFVSWDAVRRTLYTSVDTAYSAPRTTSGTGAWSTVDITHGDGTWVVYQTHECNPWTQDAAILPGALVWGRHAFAARDWAKGSASHGNAKIVGSLGDGVSLQATNDDGEVGMSAEAAAYLALLQDIAQQDCPVGIKPFGADLEYITNTSRAWEVWRSLMDNAEKAAARIYLGTDGTLGAGGGAPGVDITALFGVATTITQADLSAIERGVRTGVIEPWAAVNFGDTSLAPLRRYVTPDPDAQLARDEQAKNEAAFVGAIKARRDAGLVVTQEIVDELAERYSVIGAELAATQTTGFQLAPTDLARVITANEGRASVGLGARDDGDVPLATFGAPDPATVGAKLRVA